MTLAARARVVLPDGRQATGTYDGTQIHTDVGVFTAGSVRFLAPSQPTKLVCVGLNYRDHAEEIGMPIPAEPLLFLKPVTSLAHPDDPICLRPEVTRLDYEGELTVVIGRRARRVAAAEASDYIAGLTIANDVTARNFQRPDTQWTRAKGYDTFAPVGPWMVESSDWSGRKITTMLNGEPVQSSSTDRLIFGVPTLIEFISSIMTLEPGDLILTGTPSGIGPMTDGDVVEISIEGIGTLRNTVVAEP